MRIASHLVGSYLVESYLDQDRFPICVFYLQTEILSIQKRLKCTRNVWKGIFAETWKSTSRLVNSWIIDLINPSWKPFPEGLKVNAEAKNPKFDAVGVSVWIGLFVVEDLTASLIFVRRSLAPAAHQLKYKAHLCS